MTVDPALDAPRPSTGEGFSDALTVALADTRAGIYGTVRLGLAGGSLASGLVVLFRGSETAAVAAEGAVECDDGSTWEAVKAAGIDFETVTPLQSWRLSFAGQDGSLDLELEASGEACALGERDPVARAGGMLGFEQPLRVRGVARLAGERIDVDGLGQRGRSWGDPDWSQIRRTRTVGAWFDAEALSVTAIARDGEEGHGGEAISAAVLGADGCTSVADPRLSTTFDGEGRQRRATLELWIGDEGPPRRAAGDVICGTTLDLGRLRLDTAFLQWRSETGTGAGRYDVLRRTAA